MSIGNSINSSYFILCGRILHGLQQRDWEYQNQRFEPSLPINYTVESSLAEERRTDTETQTIVIRIPF